MNGEGVAQAMDAWAVALVVSYGALAQQAPEGLIDRRVGQAAAALVEGQGDFQ